MDKDGILAELMGMGFDLSLATQAINQPGCSDTQSAVNWILGHNSEPSLGPRLVLNPLVTNTHTDSNAMNVDETLEQNSTQNHNSTESKSPSLPPIDDVKGRLSKYEGREQQIENFQAKEREKFALEMQRKRELEAKEKERVKRLLEEDKRKKEEKKKQQMTPQTTSESTSSSPTVVAPSKKSEFCTLRIRLTNGKQVQNKFQSSAHLSEVIEFVTASGEPLTKFYLMQSFPNKSFKGVNCSLEEAGLCPSSSLVVHKLAEEEEEEEVTKVVVDSTPPVQLKEETEMEVVDPNPIASTSNPSPSIPTIPSEDHNIRLEKIRNAWAEAEQQRRFQPAPQPIETSPEHEMAVDLEPVTTPNVPQVDLEMRRRMAEIASRRSHEVTQTNSSNSQNAIKRSIIKVRRLEEICVKIVCELVASKDSFNPLKTLKGTTASVGEMIAKALMNDRKLDHYTLQKLLPCHLRNLKFDGYPLTTNQILEVSGKHLNLVTLSSRSSQYITDSGVLKLGNLRNLTHLDIGFCNLTDICLPAILNMKQLSYINMQGTKVSDQGIKSLVDNLPLIESADFGSCPNLTSLALIFIQDWTKLRTLNLEKTKLNNLKGLTGCKNLEHLNISRNSIISDSFSAIGSCVKLLSLNILDTGLFDEDIVVLKGLPSLSLINFPSRIINIDMILKIFSELPLTELDLDSFTELSDKGVSYLPSFSKTLKKLSLSNTKITKDSVANILKLKSLQELYLDRVPIPQEFLAKLNDFPKLEVLSLSETNLDNNSASQIISGLRESLKSLNLSHTLIRNRTLDVVRGLKKLSYLNISGSEVTISYALSFSLENPHIKFKRDGLPETVNQTYDD